MQHSSSVHGITAHVVAFASSISTLPLPTHVYDVHSKAAKTRVWWRKKRKLTVSLLKENKKSPKKTKHSGKKIEHATQETYFASPMAGTGRSKHFKASTPAA